MLDEHIYIGQLFLTGNRLISSSKRKTIGLKSHFFFDKDNEQKVYHILLVTLSIVLYSSNQ
jgi:hypothetical protein